MGTVMDLVGKFRNEPAEAEAAEMASSATAPMRNAGQMLAGCEYELRQMRREMLATRAAGAASGPASAIREPFVLGARLRNDAFRSRLAATNGYLPAEKDSAGE